MEKEDNKKCKFCIDLDKMCWECPNEPHKGEEAICEECGANYFRLYNRDAVATNDEAKRNHPELETI